MEQYKGDFSPGADYSELEMKRIIDDFTKEWSTDELIELLGECEFALSYNAGRIDQLKAKGLKRLCNIITGINRKNKQIVMDNVQAIQEITLRIQKILMKRIDIVSTAYLCLNDKVNTEIFWTRDTIKKLLRKLKNVSVKEDLTSWQVNVRNMRMANGHKYIEASDGVKILLAVSDIFQIVRGQIDLVEEPHLETTLNESLELPSNMRVSDFYKDIINDKDCLSLYVRKDYDYSKGNISPYGQMIRKIHDFYSDYHIIEMAKNINRPLEDMCRETYGKMIHEEDEIISPSGLCLKLLEDLADLDCRQQIKIGEQTPHESDKESDDFYKCQEKNAQEEYSVLRMTPEGCWLFKNENASYNKTDFEYDYSFSEEKNIKTYLDGVSPYMVTVPSGYFENCMPEIKSILLNKTKYVSLADYYMYLWFGHMNKDERKSRRVAFIEYYAHDMYVSAYVVDKSGDSYQKEYQKATIHYNKVKANIEKAIMSLPVFEGLAWGNVLIFKTFTADKYIDKKLAKIGVKMVDNAWEDIFKTTNEELGKIINDMLHVTKES